jgi:hypothetical protein
LESLDIAFLGYPLQTQLFLFLSSILFIFENTKTL